MKKVTLFLALGLLLSLTTQAKTIDLATYDAAVAAQDGDVITGVMSTTKPFQLKIADQATVTLRDVTIEGVNDEDYKWAGITCNGHATIILEGENTVRGFYEKWPGIQINKGKNLTIKGSGILNVSPFSSEAYAAAIGGKMDQQCGNIKIDGGIIYAQSGRQSAAIGGGLNGDCGTIEITNNVVKLKATKHATSPLTIGHGGGIGAISGQVTIGGQVYTDITTSPYTFFPVWDSWLSNLNKGLCVQDGESLRGKLAKAHQIYIDEGATVTLWDADINWDNNLTGTFPGLTCLGSATIILKGTNKVRAFDNSSGIYVPVDATLTIKEDATYGGSLEVRGSMSGAAIGGDANRDCGSITIESGTIDALGYNGAGIGAGYQHNCGNITIKGGSIKAVGFNGSAGIGGSQDGTHGEINIAKTITSIYAKGDVETDACSIGRGKNGSGSNKVYVFGLQYSSGLTENPFDGTMAYTEFIENQDTLHYYYGKGWQVSQNTIEFYRGKDDNRFTGYAKKIKVVRIDESMKAWKPTSLRKFLCGGDDTRSLEYVTEIQGLENVNTEDLTDLYMAFDKLRSLDTLNLSMWNVAKVENLRYVFGNCNKLKTLDINTWQPANATNTNRLFNNCALLETIYANYDWSGYTTLTTSTEMFYNCPKLVGGTGTKFSVDGAKDKSYAHIDGGTSDPGYFTSIEQAKAPLDSAILELGRLKTEGSFLISDFTDIATAINAAINDAKALKKKSDATLQEVFDGIDAAYAAIPTQGANLAAKLKTALNTYLDNLVTDADSDACKQLVADAKTKINNEVAWDDSKSVYPNTNALSELATYCNHTTADAVKVQRAKDQLSPLVAEMKALRALAADYIDATKLAPYDAQIKAAEDMLNDDTAVEAAIDNATKEAKKNFDAAVIALMTAAIEKSYVDLGALLQTGDPQECQDSIQAAKDAATQLEWDDTKSVSENKTALLAAFDAIFKKAQNDLKNIRDCVASKPTNLQFERGTNTLDVTWESTGTYEWQVQIRKASETTFFDEDDVPLKYAFFFGLEPNTEYVVRVRTWSNNNFHPSEWTEATVSTLALTPVSGCEFTGFYQDVNLLGATWNAASKALVEAAFTPATGAVYAIKAGSSVLYRTVGETMEVVADGFVIVPGLYNYEVTVEITDSEYTFPDDMYTITATVDNVAWSVRGATISATENSIVIFSPTLELKDTPSDIETVTGNPSPVTEKILRNGQLYILRDGKTYNAQGTEIQ